MVIYNITTHVESSIEKSWLNWMKEKHLPETLATKKFKAIRIFKIISKNVKGVSYTAQHHSDDKNSLEQYINGLAAKFREDAVNKFGDRIFLSFRTELELIGQQP